MYNVYLDGYVLFSTGQTDEENIILNPMLNLEVNKSGFFSFTLPPGHALYDKITKMKSVVTVEQDSVEIFRGRVLNEEVDFFNQKNVSCEGELCYFLDSLQPPCEFDGTAMELLQQILDNHNSAVEEEKQFTLGTVTAISADQKAQVEKGHYTDTTNELDTRILGAYGGYLRIRHADGKRYLDYLSETDTNTQPIEFGVNLLDLTKNISANELFTVLYPLGASNPNNDGKPLDIAKVNNGFVYIEDAEAIAKYGRICRTKTWAYIDDAEKLLAKAREYLATGISEETTLTIKAVDMHFVDDSKQRIGVGDMVRIVSNPHGLDRTIICYQMEVDILNPENTQYTFGKKAETLTDNAVLAKKKLGANGIEEKIREWNTWADIFEDDATAQLQLTTGAINIMNGHSSGADIDLNGVVPLVKLSAHTQDIDTLTGKVDQAEASILVNTEGIKAIVEDDGVISLINQTSGAVTIDADKINLQGYVTASNLQASIADLNYANSQVIETLLITANQTDFNFLKASSFTFNGDLVSKRNVTMGSITSAGKALTTGGELDLSHSHKFSVADDGTVTLGEVTSEAGNFNIADTKFFKDAVSAAGVPNLSGATGPVPTQAGLATLASSLGTTSDNLIRCFSSVTVSNSGYYGFKVTAGNNTKYYYFIVT